MSNSAPVRALLMEADVKDSGYGFHRLAFKVDVGRPEMATTTVLISQDACRKLTGQLSRAQIRRIDRMGLLQAWARWEIAMRLGQSGTLASTVTITADDIDDFGAYALDLARSLGSR